MRTPLWETSTGALTALLNSGQPLIKADLFTLTMPDGATVYRWVGGDLPLTYNGNTWALGPLVKRSAVKFATGMKVDTMTVSMSPQGGDGWFDSLNPGLTGPTPTLTPPVLVGDLLYGALYGARVQLDKAFWGIGMLPPVGVLQWFQGRVADIEADRYGITMTVNSDIELLDVMLPRDVYQAPCLNVVYDANCGKSQAAMTVSGTVPTDSAAHPTQFAHGLSGYVAGYFNQGLVTWDPTSSNPGMVSSVKSYDATYVYLATPLQNKARAGDLFKIAPGCDGSMATCAAKFSNVARFRGQPFIPVPETVM